MNKENVLTNLKIAEKGWIEARKLALKLVKPDAYILDVTEQIETKIKEYCDCAFPLNISVNNQAAHYTPLSDCIEKIEREDVIKIDVGTHSNGYIVDAAFTIDLKGDQQKLLDASKNALNAAVKYVRENGVETEYGKLGEIIEKEIIKLGFKPIYNLTGHSMMPYEIHAGQSILNYLTENKKKLGEGLFAIEPFATNGTGYVHDGNFCGIYFYMGGNSRNLNARKIIEDAKKTNGLPFAERWVGKGIKPFAKKLALQQLIKEKVIRKASVLQDIQGSLVSQHEKTVLITKEKVYVFPDIEF